MSYFSVIKLQIALAPFVSAMSILRTRTRLRLPPKTVVMTFDDGPNKAHDTTERLLEILKKYKVKAHFSLIGRNIDTYPDIVRSIACENHSIVNHGYRHICPFNTSDITIERDITLCNQSRDLVLGKSNQENGFYRPPQGMYRLSFEKVLKAHSLRLMPVSFYSIDAEVGPSKMNMIVKRNIEGIIRENGGIIVLHDGKNIDDPAKPLLTSTDPNSKYNRSWIPQAAEIIISTLQQKGFQFVLWDG